MSVTDLKAEVERLGLTEKHIASKTGLDTRTIRTFLETGKGRFSTEQAIISAVRELARERSESLVSPEEPKRSTA